MPEQPPGAKRVPSLERLRYTVEFDDPKLSGEDARLAAVATLPIAQAAFESAVQQYPTARLMMRNRAMIMRRHPEETARD